MTICHISIMYMNKFYYMVIKDDNSYNLIEYQHEKMKRDMYQMEQHLIIRT